MTQPHIRTVATNLQRQMARPGGLTFAQAERQAQAGLDAQRDQTLAALQTHAAALTAVCAARPADGPAQVYALGSAMVDIAGFLDVPPFYAAAYSLCDVADRMTATGAWSWPSIAVHAHALSLILAEGCRSTPATEELLTGLRAVAQHTGRTG